MNNFVKIYGSIIRSTVWQSAPHIKLTWLTMLILADADGRVEASIPGLATTAGVTIEQCEEALAKFMAPDKYSRTKDNEGRRIAEIAGGWQVLNHKIYRDMRSRTQQQATERKQRQRAKAKKVTRSTRGSVTRDDLDRDQRDNRDSRDMSRVSRTDPDPDPDLELIPGDRVSAKDLTGSARAAKPARGKPAHSHYAPDDFEPTDAQRAKLTERGCDVDDTVARFKAHAFPRNYSRWDKRFDEWILDAPKFDRDLRGVQPANGATGWEPAASETINPPKRRASGTR